MCVFFYKCMLYVAEMLLQTNIYYIRLLYLQWKCVVFCP